MIKARKIHIWILTLVFLLTVSNHSNAAPNIRTIRTVIGRIEQGGIPMLGEISLIPEDCSGFEVQYRAFLPGSILKELNIVQPAHQEDRNEIIHRLLDTAAVRNLFDHSYAISIAPDGSVLWIAYFSADAFMFVQHQRTLVILFQSINRGVQDKYGSLKNVLDHKMKVDPLEGEVRWSPDSRYLFFNDTDRWLGSRYSPEDPYIIDTQTGEIFLREDGGYPKNQSHGEFRCVMNGFFSMDGNSFCWYCKSLSSDKPTAHFFMQYDLQSGTIKRLCELNGSVIDFIEVKENHWFLLEKADDKIGLVRLFITGNDCIKNEEYLSVSWESCHFLPAVRGKVLLAVTPSLSGGTYLLPLTWDTPASSSSWYKIISVHDTSLQNITVHDMEAEFEEVKRNSNGISSSKAIRTANIKHAAAIIGVTNLLLTIFIREPIPESWGGGFRDFNGQIILNTETLNFRPIYTTSFPDGLQDRLIDGNNFLINGYNQFSMGLFAQSSLPDYIFVQGESVLSPYGIFMCRNECDPLVLSSVMLENRACSADITINEDGYTIDFYMIDHPEPDNVRMEFCVPEILSEDRWKTINSGLSKKDQKKISNMYSKITPDKLAERKNSEELIASYPSAAKETIYILLDGLKKDSLESAERIFEATGYTPDDYARDMETIAVLRETNIIVMKPKSESIPFKCTFDFTDPHLYSQSGRILELAGLCDQIGSEVMANRVSSEPQPVESIIHDLYDMGTVDFHVRLLYLEQTENALNFTLSVIP